MFSKIAKYQTIFLLLAIIGLIAGIFMWRYLHQRESLSRLGSLLQVELGKWEEDFEQITDNTALLQKLGKEQLNDPNVAPLEKLPYSLLLYRNDSLVYWNNNHVLLPSDLLKEQRDDTRLVRLGNGFYQVCRKTLSPTALTTPSDTLKVFALQLIQAQFGIQNKYLHNGFATNLSMPDYVSLTDQILTDSVKKHHEPEVYLLYNRAKKDRLYLSYITPTNTPTKINYLFIALQIITTICFILWLSLSFISLANRYPTYWWLLVIIFSSLLVGLRLMMFCYDVDSNTWHWEALSKREVYFANVAHLLQHALGITWLIAAVRQMIPQLPDFKTYPLYLRLVLYYITCIVLFLFAFMVFLFAKTIVLYFDISFGVANFIWLSSDSWFALFTFGMFWVVFMLLMQNSSRLINTLNLSVGQRISGFIMLGLLYELVIIRYDFSWIHFFVFIWLLVWLYSVNRYRLEFRNSISSFRFMAWVGFFSFLLSFLIFAFNRQNDLENSKLFAARIAIQEDPVTEDVLGRQLEKAIFDPVVSNYFAETPTASDNSESLARYLHKNYLNDPHLEQYNINIVAEGQYGELVEQDGPTVVSSKEYEYKMTNTLRTNNNYVFLTKGEPGSYNYLAKLPIFTENSLGYIYIEMIPKLDKVNVYPELTIEDRYRQPDIFSDFDYAVYNNKILESEKGNYQYPTILDSTLLASISYAISDTVLTTYYRKITAEDTIGNGLASKRFIGSRTDTLKVGSIVQEIRDTLRVTYSTLHKNNYTHLIYQLQPSKTVVVTSRAVNIISLIALFAYVGLFFLLTSFAALLLTFLIDGKTIPNFIKSVFYPSLRQRINFFVISIMITAFLVTGAVSAFYFYTKSDDSNRSLLIKKQQEVLQALQTAFRNDIDKKDFTDFENFLSVSNPYLHALTKSLADIHGIDINVFNHHGQITGSSQPRIFTEQLIGLQIHPAAYQYIKYQHQQDFLQNEHIGSLRYLAAYMPINNQQNRLIGFVNIPYFAREKEFRREISAFLVQLVNVFILLLAIGSLLTVWLSNNITNPLLMISDRLRGIELGKKNELLTWPDDDEIGKLVQQYNQTVLQLEQSAKLLAQSERQSAWQSMARQVAHEIKNPLTPMKLSIEHLQRAYKDNHPNARMMTDKVLTRLIEQIDILSEIATEFSNFAKMPAPINEILNLNTILQSIVDLHQDTEGVTIHSVLPAQTAWVFADKNQLLRVFTNIVKNAIQAIPDEREGIIVVNMKLNEQQVVIGIADNGTGIPEEMREKVFSPNFTTKNSGMGLGLAMSQNIIETAKGKIWFQTVLDEGTTFFVQLPLSQID